MHFRRLLVSSFFTYAVVALAPAIRASPGPVPAASAPAVPAPRDEAFVGTITLDVDATDIRHRIFSIHETIPIQRRGEVTLLYPQWETSSHASTAAIANLAGLIIRADGKRISWRRDPVNVYAFHVEVPDGSRQLEVDFQFLSAIGPRARPVVMSASLINVQWQSLLLYPAGWFARNLPISTSLTLPPGFSAASSLRASRTEKTQTEFEVVDLETLVDAPVYAGLHHRTISLGPTSSPPIRAHFVADEEADLDLPSSEIERLNALIVQTRALFGTQHFDHYDFLFSLSDRLPSGGGLEHLRSSEINLPPKFFRDFERQLPYRDLIAHEFVHSWNGRFRQPADLWTANFNEPMRDSLLWVYEGQTEFWGCVLAARAGYRTVTETLDAIAIDAAIASTRAGRSWKSLADSNHDPLFMAGRPIEWRDWQRREDYYPEGVLLWLDVAGIIRERTDGDKSLDDFAREFFGMNAESSVIVTYTFEELCAALKTIAPFDWPTFFRQRLETHDDVGLLDGLERAGFRLVYSEIPTLTFLQTEADAGAADFNFSVGFTVTDHGIVRSLRWNSPAFTAGLTIGAQITRVNGEPFSLASLQRAIANSNEKPTVLDFEIDGTTARASIDYQGPLRYPHLEPIAGKSDQLLQLLRARTP